MSAESDSNDSDDGKDILDERPWSTSNAKINCDMVKTTTLAHLQELVNGDLYMEHGLEENKISSILSEGERETLKTFVGVIITSLMAKTGISSAKKKAKKKMQEDLKPFMIDIEEEIQVFIQKRDGKPTPIALNVMKGDESESISVCKPVTDNENGNEVEPKEKPKKKTKKSKPKVSKKNETDHVNEDVFENQPFVPETEETLMERRRKLFEEERAKIILTIPENMKKRFRQQYFAKWRKEWLPVLELSPFDVEPGPVRDQWLKMAKNVAVNKRPMSHLLFWYGTIWDDRSTAYSFLPRSTLISFEDGVAKGYLKVPKIIQKKLDSDKPLSQTDNYRLLSLEQIEQDSMLPPEERIKWMSGFPESYQMDDYEDPDERQPTMNGKSAAKESGKDIARKNGQTKPKAKDKVKVKAKAKAKEPRKVIFKDDFEPDVEMEEVESEEEEEYNPTKGGKKKPKQAEPKKKKQAEPIKKKQTEPIKKKQTEPIKKKQTDPIKKKQTDPIKKKLTEPIKKKQTEPTKKKLTEPIKKKKKKKKKESDNTELDKETHNNTLNEKVPKMGDAVPKKREISKKRTKEDSTDEAASKKKVKRRKKTTALAPICDKEVEDEKNTFEKSEEGIKPYLEILKSDSIKAIDMELINKCLGKVDKLASTLSCGFMETENLPRLVKKIGKTFKKDPVTGAKCDELYQKLKSFYYDQKKKIKLSDTKIEDQKLEEKEEMDETASSNSVQTPATVKVEDADNIDKSPQQSAPIPSKQSSPKVKTENLSNDETNIRMSTKEKTSSLEQKSVPKKGATITEEPLQQQVVTLAPKPIRKSFSLKGMLQGPKPTAPKAIAQTPDRKSVLSSTAKFPSKKEIPKWITVSDNCSMVDEDEDRSFALEFLMDGVKCFPEINRTPIAQNLEEGIFEWSQKVKLMNGLSRWDEYWEKIHDVVGGIRGKYKAGSISSMIVEGFFQTPMGVVELTREKLYESLLCLGVD